MQKNNEMICNCIRDFVRLDAIDAMVNYVEGEPVFLRTLIGEGKKSTPSVMAERMNVSKGRITALINRLSEKGYVEAKQSKEDKRKTEVEITESGEKFVTDLKEKIDERIAGIYDLLGKGKAQKLLDLMDYAIEKANKK